MATSSKLESAHFDKDGFLLDPDQWDESLAAAMARADGISELTEDHWTIIHSLRKHYSRYHAPALMRHICQINNMGKHCVDELFQHHSREAWRIAGLPNPGEEAFSYMD